MAIIKDVILIGASFTTGYLVGASDDTATKVKIENFLHLVDHRYQETKKLVVTTLDSIEGVDVEEWKVNIQKTIDSTKETIQTMIDAAPANQEIQTSFLVTQKTTKRNNKQVATKKKK